MKRSKFGFGLLLALLILGLVSTWAIIRSTAPITETLRRAGERGFLGDWDDAMASMAEAKGCWEKTYPLCASLTDHEPMEDINSLFAQLEVYARERDSVGFRVLCARLAEALDAIGEAHSVAWWNLA